MYRHHEFDLQNRRLQMLGHVPLNVVDAEIIGWHLYVIDPPGEIRSRLGVIRWAVPIYNVPQTVSWMDASNYGSLGGQFCGRTRCGLVGGYEKHLLTYQPPPCRRPRWKYRRWVHLRTLRRQICPILRWEHFAKERGWHSIGQSAEYREFEKYQMKLNLFWMSMYTLNESSNRN